MRLPLGFAARFSPDSGAAKRAAVITIRFSSQSIRHTWNFGPFPDRRATRSAPRGNRFFDPQREERYTS